MATKAKSSYAHVDEAAARMRELNEQFTESARRAGDACLDLYERTLTSVADYEDRLADTSQLGWVQALASAQADFTRGVAGAYSAAARGLIE